MGEPFNIEIRLQSSECGGFRRRFTVLRLRGWMDWLGALSLSKR
jgi:hypothetical protein